LDTISSSVLGRRSLPELLFVSGLLHELILNGYLYLSDVWLDVDLVTCLNIHDLREIGLHVQHALVILCSNFQCN